MRESTGSAVRWLSCSGAPVYAPDSSLKLGVITIQDISSRKQDAVALQIHTDALRQTNAELTRALHLKDEFLAMLHKACLQSIASLRARRPLSHGEE